MTEQSIITKPTHCFNCRNLLPNDGSDFELQWPTTGERMSFCVKCAHGALKALDEMGYEVR